MTKVRPILKELIAERHKKDPEFNQTKLAELSGVPQAAISRFDRNERVDIDNLFSIAEALHMKVDDLFEKIDDKE